jgi:hypothetical protein
MVKCRGEPTCSPSVFAQSGQTRGSAPTPRNPEDPVFLLILRLPSTLFRTGRRALGGLNKGVFQMSGRAVRGTGQQDYI